MKEDPDFFFFFLHIPFLWKHYGKQRGRLLSGGAAWCVPISADTQKKIWQAHLKLFSLNDYIENIEHWKQRHHHREHEML